MRSYRNLHRFIIFTTVCTFVLIVAGGLVTSTGSGLSVPDWPNTYGQFMFSYPLNQMEGGVEYEHTHRLIASFVGFLTVIAVVWLWRREERRWVRWLGVGALAMVIVQGVLGGITVLMSLPTAISVGHATLGQMFLALMAVLALVTSPRWKEIQPIAEDSTKIRSVARLAIAATVVIYVQLVLGAWMRHSDAGLAVPDFPLAYGKLFPSLSPDAIQLYNQQSSGLVTADQIIIHMLHRLWALVVAVIVVWLSVRLVTLPKTAARLARFGRLLPGLIIVQVTLGAFTVLSLRNVDITTAHVAVGALLLMCCVLVAVESARLLGWRTQPATVALPIQEATT